MKGVCILPFGLRLSNSCATLRLATAFMAANLPVGRAPITAKLTSVAACD